MFYAQSNAKGPIRAKQNVFLPQVQIRIHYFILTHSTIEERRHFGKKKLNEAGRQKLGQWKPCKQEQHTALQAIF